jgi:hypothetical protein
MDGGASASLRSGSVRAAAERLAAVYLQLGENGELPLGPWATFAYFGVKGGNIPNLDKRILTAISDVGWEGRDDRYSREKQYIESYGTVVDAVRRAAIEAAFEMFHRQALALGDFDRRLASQGIADRLSEIADRVRQRVDGFLPSGPDVQRAEKLSGPAQQYDSATGSYVPNPNYWKALSRAFEARVRQELAATLKEYGAEVGALRSRPTASGRGSADGNALRREAVALCKVLSLHPELVKILDYYSQDAGLGGRLAHRLIREAVEAMADFIGDINKPGNMVWRFPPIVAMGVKRLHLEDIEGFPEFAVDIGLVLGRDWRDSALAAVGYAVLLLGLLLTGPAATGVLLLDAGLTGASLAFTYFREREQDLLAVGGGFSSERLAERSDYSGTKLAAVGALLTGIALVFQGAKLFKGWRERKVGTLPRPTEPPQPPGVAARQRTRQPKLPGPRATEGKELNRATGSRARVSEEEWRPPARPRWDERTRPQYESARASATGTGGGELPSSSKASPSRPEGAGVPQTAPGGTATTGVSTPPAAPTPPGGSSVGDTTFSLTPYQRTASTKVLTELTEGMVGQKLEAATGLKARESGAIVDQLSAPIPPGKNAPPITKPVLLKQPAITSPNAATASKGLSSFKPDYLVMNPNKIEVFEVTVDARFQLIPQEKGMRFSGSAVPQGWPHKIEQLSKAEYLIRRYPQTDIVFNIQTIGQVPKATIDRVREVATYLSNARKSAGAKGLCEIIIRADETTVVPVP